MRADKFNGLLSRLVLLATFALYPIFLLFAYKGMFVLTLGGLLFVVGLDLAVRRGQFPLNLGPLPVYAFYLLPLVSTLWARYPADTLWNGALVLVNSAIFYLTLKADRMRRYKLMEGLALIIPLVSFIAFVFILLKYGSVRVTSRAMHADVKSISNHGAALTVLCVPYLLAMTKIWIRNWIVYIFLAMAVVVVVLSQSRGAYLMLFIILVVSPYILLFSSRERLLHYARLVIAALAIGLSATMWFGYDRAIAPVVERFAQSQILSGGLDAPTQGEADYARALIYSTGIDLIREEPWLGIGYAAFPRYMEEQTGFYYVSHNLFITLWGEMGVPGLIAGGWLLVSVTIALRRGLRSPAASRRDHLFLAATALALIIAFLHAQFRPFLTNPLIPVLLAQAYAARRIAIDRTDPYRTERRIAAGRV